MSAICEHFARRALNLAVAGEFAREHGRSDESYASATRILADDVIATLKARDVQAELSRIAAATRTAEQAQGGGA